MGEKPPLRMSGEKERQKCYGLVRRWQAVLWKHFLFRSKKTDRGRAYQKEVELCGTRILLLSLIKWNSICWFHFYYLLSDLSEKSAAMIDMFCWGYFTVLNLKSALKSGSLPAGNLLGHLTFKSHSFIPCLLHFPIDVIMKINSIMWF